jgi:hypothetical protein
MMTIGRIYSEVGNKGCHYDKLVNVTKDEKHRRLIYVDWERKDDQ